METKHKNGYTVSDPKFIGVIFYDQENKGRLCVSKENIEEYIKEHMEFLKFYRPVSKITKELL